MSAAILAWTKRRRRAGFRVMSSTRVQCVGGGMLADLGLGDGASDGSLQDGFVHVVALPLPCLMVDVVVAGGEEPLPGPVPTGPGILSIKRVWQRNGASARGKVGFVLFAHLRQMHLEGRIPSSRQHRDPILSALAIADGQLMSVEVQILHPQFGALQYAKARAVEQSGQLALDRK
jgi:hypothetical protein